MIYKGLVDDDMLFSESDKPRYLLPEGCKDLYDAIRLQDEDAAVRAQRAVIISAALEKNKSVAAASSPSSPSSPSSMAQLSNALEKHFGTSSKERPLCVAIPDTVTVGDLADMLHVKAFKVISALIKLHIFASSDCVLTFDTASQICTHLGVVVVKKTGET